MFMFRIYGSRVWEKGNSKFAIDEKHDKCDICQIGVTDNQFATEIILENGKALKFDDIGCMYKWMEINSGEKTKEKFVRDYDSKDWISLEEATYVYDKTITTPMAYNVISFKNKKMQRALYLTIRVKFFRIKS